MAHISVANKTYDTGDGIQMDITVTDIDDNPTTPATLSLDIKEPDGNIVSKSLAGGDFITGGTGEYTYVFTPDQAGRHTYRWAATGPDTARESAFTVRPTQVV